MTPFLKKINNYIRAKVLDKIDYSAWKFDENSYSNFLVYEKSDKNLINHFYPHIHLEDLKEDNAEDKFLIEQFTSYIYRFEKKVMVEPLYGWVITDKMKVFNRSFPYVFDVWDNKKRMPALLNFLLPKKVIEIDSCIPIRYYWQNYYHFFLDTLSQVYLAKDKIPPEVPILVPYYFEQIKYVSEFLKASKFLDGRKIIVQKKDEYYSVKNLYLCKDTFNSDSVYEVVGSFGDIVNGADKKGRKIFLRRNKSRSRAIANDEEIEKIVSEYGFEIRDTDGMSLKEQIVLFRDVDMLIGLHGAGLTNIIFRNGRSLKLLEIFPGDLHPGYYSNLCRKFNYDYDSIKGSSMDLSKNRSFSLDPDLLREKLKAFTC